MTSPVSPTPWPVAPRPAGPPAPAEVPATLTIRGRRPPRPRRAAAAPAAGVLAWPVPVPAPAAAPVSARPGLDARARPSRCRRVRPPLTDWATAVAGGHDRPRRHRRRCPQPGHPGALARPGHRQPAPTRAHVRPTGRWPALPDDTDQRGWPPGLAHRDAERRLAARARAAGGALVERVAFLVEESGARLDCLLNPETLEVGRLAGVRPWASAPRLTGAGLADDPLHLTGGGRTEPTLDLLFDVDLVPTPGPARRGPDTAAVAAGRELRHPAGGPPAAGAVPVGQELEHSRRGGGRGRAVRPLRPGGAPQRSWLRLRFLRVAETAADAQATYETMLAEQQNAQAEAALAQAAEGAEPAGSVMAVGAGELATGPPASRALRPAGHRRGGQPVPVAAARHLQRRDRPPAGRTGHRAVGPGSSPGAGRAPPPSGPEVPL